MEPGTRIGPYEVTAALGAGGMGEVHRARDTRVDREVALKVLPEAFAGDAERLCRLRREAQLLAQLSHPNVAQLYGLEEHEERFLVVMELAAGDTLDARIRRGPLPLTEVVPIAEQICRGLAAAHARGIVHRDLKPANVMVAEDATGRLTVKVLDFGLAKAVATTAGGDLSASPTEVAATREGVIQGTAPYMSPEQARGKAADQRTDVWAFGCVLYEMLVGKRAFGGATISDVIAAILQGEPDLGALPRDAPPGLRRLLRRCLAKGPDERLRDLHDVRLALHDALEGPESVPARPRRSPVGAALVAAGALATALLIAWMIGPLTPDPLVTRLSIPLPEGQLITTAPSISADGRTIAYATSTTPATGGSRIMVRPLDAAEPTALPSSEGGEYPALSPDGSEVVFARNGALWRAATAGGDPAEIMPAPVAFGVSWISASELLVSPDLSRLVRVSIADGQATPVTEVDRANGEYAHTWPQVLSGGRHAIFRVWGSATNRGTALLDFETGTRRMVAPFRFGFYSPAGILATIDNTSNTLRATRLSLDGETDLSGEVPVLEGFNWSVADNREWIAVSDNGTLVYARGDPANRRFVWEDGSGFPDLVDPDRRVNIDPKLSFDGTKIVFREHGDVWLKDLTTGVEQVIVGSDRGRVTNFAPLFSADDHEIVFASNRSGDWELWAQPIDGSDAYLLLERPGFQNAQSVGPDGTLVFVDQTPESNDDLWVLPPDGEPRPLLVTPWRERQARLSPDGELVAFTSHQSGAPEIHVMPMAGGGPSVRVSVRGGFDAAWAPDAQALYFWSGDRVMRAVRLEGTEPRFAAPEPFLETANVSTSFGRAYDVAADGRLLMIRPEPDSMPDQLNVVLNWFEELERLLGPPR